MTIPEAINILKLCLKWREGEEIPSVGMPEFKQAIDLAIIALSQDESVSKAITFKSKL